MEAWGYIRVESWWSSLLIFLPSRSWARVSMHLCYILCILALPFILPSSSSRRSLPGLEVSIVSLFWLFGPSVSKIMTLHGFKHPYYEQKLQTHWKVEWIGRKGCQHLLRTRMRRSKVRGQRYDWKAFGKRKAKDKTRFESAKNPSSSSKHVLRSHVERLEGVWREGRGKLESLPLLKLHLCQPEI